MDDTTAENESIILDAGDRRLLIALQRDCTQSLERIAKQVGLSKSAVWNRIQRLTQAGVILRQSAMLDAKKVGLKETFYVTIKTSQHNDQWLAAFKAVIQSMPQITEAHRLAGSLDYLLKVQVTSTEAYDAFYKDLVSRIDLMDVSSSLSMETMKKSLSLPITAD